MSRDVGGVTDESLGVSNSTCPMCATAPAPARGPADRRPADPPTRTWTAAERRAGVGWGTVFPPTWSGYATPDVAG
jgi:hypothetical protein